VHRVLAALGDRVMPALTAGQLEELPLRNTGGPEQGHGVLVGDFDVAVDVGVGVERDAAVQAVRVAEPMLPLDEEPFTRLVAGGCLPVLSGLLDRGGYLVLPVRQPGHQELWCGGLRQLTQMGHLVPGDEEPGAATRPLMLRGCRRAPGRQLGTWLRGRHACFR